MIFEKQPKHSNQGIKLIMKVRAFKKKAMGGLYKVQITYNVDTGAISSILTLGLTQRLLQMHRKYSSSGQGSCHSIVRAR